MGWFSCLKASPLEILVRWNWSKEYLQAEHPEWLPFPKEEISSSAGSQPDVLTCLDQLAGDVVAFVAVGSVGTAKALTNASTDLGRETLGPPFQ